MRNESRIQRTAIDIIFIWIYINISDCLVKAGAGAGAIVGVLFLFFFAETRRGLIMLIDQLFCCSFRFLLLFCFNLSLSLSFDYVFVDWCRICQTTVNCVYTVDESGKQVDILFHTLNNFCTWILTTINNEVE